MLLFSRFNDFNGLMIGKVMHNDANVDIILEHFIYPGGEYCIFFTVQH